MFKVDYSCFELADIMQILFNLRNVVTLRIIFTFLLSFLHAVTYQLIQRIL